MIYSPKYHVGFLHCMKCGGTSIKEYLQEQDDSFKRPHGRVIFKNYHEPLSRKIKVSGFNLRDNSVITLIRDPYTLLPSFWRFWRKLYDIRENSHRNWQLNAAHTKDFENFVVWFEKEMQYKRGESALSFWDYFNINGKIPNNLTIVKLEEIEKFPGKLEELGVKIDKSIEIKKRNISPKKDRCEHTDKTKKIIQRMFKWVFDQGYYKK